LQREKKDKVRISHWHL